MFCCNFGSANNCSSSEIKAILAASSDRSPTAGMATSLLLLLQQLITFAQHVVFILVVAILVGFWSRGGSRAVVEALASALCHVPGYRGVVNMLIRGQVKSYAKRLRGEQERRLTDTTLSPGGENQRTTTSDKVIALPLQGTLMLVRGHIDVSLRRISHSTSYNRIVDYSDVRLITI